MPTYYNQDDAIRGKRITCEFRKMGKKRVIRGSGQHQQQRMKLEDAYCVIVTPIMRT